MTPRMAGKPGPLVSGPSAGPATLPRPPGWNPVPDGIRNPGSGLQGMIPAGSLAGAWSQARVLLLASINVRPSQSFSSRMPGSVKKYPPPMGLMYSSSGSPSRRFCTVMKPFSRLA